MSTLGNDFSNTFSVYNIIISLYFNLLFHVMQLFKNKLFLTTLNSLRIFIEYYFLLPIEFVCLSLLITYNPCIQVTGCIHRISFFSYYSWSATTYCLTISLYFKYCILGTSTNKIYFYDCSIYIV